MSLGTVARGQLVTTYGSQYFADCRDTAVVGAPPPTSGPAGPVELTLVTADGGVQALVTAQPDARARFVVVVRIPASAPLGAASIRDPGGHEVRLDIDRRRANP